MCLELVGPAALFDVLSVSSTYPQAFLSYTEPSGALPELPNSPEPTTLSHGSFGTQGSI